MIAGFFLETPCAKVRGFLDYREAQYDVYMRQVREAILRERFDHLMWDHFPDFSLTPFGNVPRSDIVCYGKSDVMLAFCISLFISERDDRFTIRLTWHRRGSLPIQATPGRVDSQPNQHGLTIALSSLWGEADRWWKVRYSPTSEELEAWSQMQLRPTSQNLEDCYVIPRVDLAVSLALKHAPGYFRQVSQSIK